MVKSDNKGGLPRLPLICIEAKKGIIRCNIPVKKVSNQPTIDKKTKSVMPFGTGNPRITASPNNCENANRPHETLITTNEGPNRLRMLVRRAERISQM